MATVAEARTTASPRYTKVAIWLHWAIGLAVIVNIGLAMLTEGMSRDAHRAAMDVHKALGITILGLTIARLLWRIGHRAPPLPDGIAVWEAWGSRVVHFLFYALLLFLPLSGWIWMSAAGRPIDFFGLASIPTIVAPDKSLADVMHERHELLGLTMLALVTIHVLAVLKHQLWDRSRPLSRMNPF